MSPLPLGQALADYLRVRRALGFKLDRAEHLLTQFVAYLHDHNVGTPTIEDALAWATLPAAANRRWWAHRLSMARGFAASLHARDPRVELVPPALIRSGPRQSIPYLYAPADITALVAAAGKLLRPLGAATYQTLIGLLAVTGMRVGEAIRLDRDDLDADHDGLLGVRDSKFGKSRLLPLHPTTVAALQAYLQIRDRLLLTPTSPALLLSTVGTRLGYNSVWRTFHRLCGQAHHTARSPSCTPRIHDLRHSFAVATMLDWYARGDDVQALLPRLSTYLGHTDPKHTYWYLHAAPELLTLAAHRLDRPRPGARARAGRP
jgi:integrase/recombinase XerD